MIWEEMEISMHLPKEEEILFQHYRDLIQMSYQRGIPAYSNFAGFRDMELGFLALEDFYGRNQFYENIHYQLYGGYGEAERKVFCFLGGDGSGGILSGEMFPGQDLSGMEPSMDFPIACIHIAPANKRFCEPLSHRDYLGTVMGLGLARDQIGDILVEREESPSSCSCYLFCKRDKAELVSRLTRIRHTTVKAESVDFSRSGWRPSFRDIAGSVSSFRLDALLALAVKVSRSQGLALVQGGNVTLNGRCCTENAKKLQEGDVFSVRGYGKFIFEKTASLSKKGRYRITLKQYI